jgi:hypothetical protein
MLTLAQAKELSQDKLTNFVIDEFLKSPLLDLMVFDNSVTPQGSSLAYVYNRVTTFPTAATRAIGAEYVPQEAVTTQVTANLKIFGGSYQIDRVVAAYEKKIVDQVQFQSQQKAKATIALFADLFINGDAAVTPTEFDGIDKVVTGSATEVTPGAAIDLSTSANIDANWKVFLDYLRKMIGKMDGSPSILGMNGDLYAVFQSVMDRAGINLTSKSNYGYETSQWGSALVTNLGDKPGGANPIIPTANGITSLFAARIGLDGVHAVSPEGDKIVTTYLPNMTIPGAVKTGEVEMVAAAVLKATKSVGKLNNIKVA